MNPIRAQSCKSQDLAAVSAWLEQHPNRALVGNNTNPGTLQADGCLLVARGASPAATALQGVVGLDLQSGRISLLACRRGDSLPVLLDAVERLAVSFGMLELQLQIKPGPRLKMPAAWQEHGGQKDTGPGLLRRSLSRRLTIPARQAMQIHQELGIPAGYGCRHRLALQAEPAQLASIGRDVFDREQFMTPQAAGALLEMIRQAAGEDVALQTVSAFRSVDYQRTLVQNKLDKGQSIAEILRVSAAPGYSEHHSGRAVDLTTPGFKPLEEEFAASPAFAWLKRKARRFGFRLSYPRGNRHGVAYEPWHWFYLGQD